MSDDFPLAPGEHYRSPPAGNLESYREVIANVPLNPHPNVFGLHANAEIACAQNETQELCEIMLGLQAQTSSGGGKSREEMLDDHAADILSKAPDLFNHEQVLSGARLASGEALPFAAVEAAE